MDNFEFQKVEMVNACKLSYDVVQEFLDGNDIDHHFETERYKIHNGQNKEDIKTAISNLAKIAKKVREARLLKGGIVFNRQKLNFHLDDNKQPTGYYFKQQNEANRLVEEFMLLGNQ